MKKSISLFRDATIKGCAIVLSFSASVMLLQGCGDMGSLMGGGGGAGNLAMLQNLDLGFRLPGAPSGDVGKAIFYAKATVVMSEKIIEQQQGVIDELAVALGYKGNEKTAEQLAEFMDTVDGNSLTPSQKHTIERLAPAVFGLNKAGATCALAGANLGLALPAAANKVKENPVEYGFSMGAEIVGAISDIGSAMGNIDPVVKGFSKISDSYDNLASVAGIAKLSPAEEKAAEKKALVSTAGSGASFS